MCLANRFTSKKTIISRSLYTLPYDPCKVDRYIAIYKIKYKNNYVY